MADQVLGIAVEAIVSQAFSLARERISSAWGVKEDLRSLAQQLEMVQAILSDAETKSTRSRPVQLWLKKLEDAATDAYFLLDAYGYYILRKQFEKLSLDKVRRFFSSSNPIAFRFEMASKIKRINLNFDAIFKESEKIGLVRNEIIYSFMDIRNDRITDPFVVDSEVVGRNDDVKEILSKLTSFEDDDHDDLLVIGIVGMAGQGKTTLAQLVYNKEEVTRWFEKKIWVCVSDDFTVEKILNDMLQSLTGTVSVLTIRQAIVDKLKKELKEKRFLLVLDDVWNEDDQKWSCMERCLQEIGGSKGSKIIVTTRSERVVTIARKFYILQLGALSKEDSWELFEKIAFARGGAIKNPDLVAIGEKIASRCGGLPLAIRALAGLMHSRRNASEWSKIVESNIWDSLNPQTKVLSVVKLSYDHLPSLSLRQCFAYCAIFPKDFVIRREVLIQHWMAHGFLNPSQGSKLEMEDVGNNYFEILLQRSLLQDVKFDEFGNIRSCKMHDVVHDFVSQVSNDRCLIIEDGGKTEDIVASHLSIFSNRGKSSGDATLKIPSTLRTLLLSNFQNEGSFDLDGLAECKYLFVLVLCNWMIKSLPSSIAKMKHLRCLDISSTRIVSLPNSVTKLYNLQTLRLRAFEKLPRDFGNLVKLRYFTIEDENKVPLSGISRLTSLIMLPYFIVSRDRRCQIKELQYLHNLGGKLKIYGLENVSNREEAMKADLSGKRNIVNLKLQWEDEENNCEDVIEGLKPHKSLKGLKIKSFAGRNLPSWLQFLDNLVSIKLRKFNLCEQLPPLGQLSCLERIYIDGMESLKCIGNEFYGLRNHQSSSHVVSFQSLRELTLMDMPNLEQWSDPSHEFFHEVFPVLEILEIDYAPKLTHLPNVLNKSSCLTDLTLRDLDSLSRLPEGLGAFLSLEELNIDCCCLVTLNVQSFKSLRILVIEGCNYLEIFENKLELCQKLEDVTISDCASISLEDIYYPTNLQTLSLGLPEDVDYEEFPWPSKKCNYFPVLEVVELTGNSKTKSLSKQIQHLPNLRKLFVEDFGGMEILPEWLCNIPTLRELEFESCERLAYLPSREALQRLSSSCCLEFHGCPLLESSPEQDKTANLPNISFFFK